jgi:heat shock protein HslJ
MQRWTRLALGLLGMPALAQDTGPAPVNVLADAGAVSPLEGTRWRWVRFTGPDGKQLVPPRSSNYWIELLPAGQLAFLADCNRGHGRWAPTGKALQLEPLATTLMACPPGSLDSRFLQLLSQAASYELRGGDLVLALQGGAGIVHLAPIKAGTPAKSTGGGPPPPK